MQRSDRLFEIIQILRVTAAPVTAPPHRRDAGSDDAHHLPRIAALQAMRVPVENAAGLGYVLRAGFDLPPLMFTAEEIETIAVGLALLGRTGDGGLRAAASSVARKIEDVPPPAAGSRLCHTSLYISRNFQ